MAIALRTLDDGAWISINDSRQVSVSDIWRLSEGSFCACTPAFVLIQGFTNVSVDAPIVYAGIVGQCLECGENGSIDRLAVGRMLEGTFEPYEPDSLQWSLETHE